MSDSVDIQRVRALLILGFDPSKFGRRVLNGVSVFVEKDLLPGRTWCVDLWIQYPVNKPHVCARSGVGGTCHGTEHKLVTWPYQVKNRRMTPLNVTVCHRYMTPTTRSGGTSLAL